MSVALLDLGLGFWLAGVAYLLMSVGYKRNPVWERRSFGFWVVGYALLAGYFGLIGSYGLMSVAIFFTVWFFYQWRRGGGGKGMRKRIAKLIGAKTRLVLDRLVKTMDKLRPAGNGLPNPA